MTKTKLVKITDRMDTLERKVDRLNRLMNNQIYGQRFVNAWIEIKQSNINIP